MHLIPIIDLHTPSFFLSSSGYQLDLLAVQSPHKLILLSTTKRASILSIRTIDGKIFIGGKKWRAATWKCNIAQVRIKM